MATARKTNWGLVAMVGAAFATVGFVLVRFYFPHWLGFTPRLSVSGEPVTPQLPDLFDMVRRVRNRAVAAGVHLWLDQALSQWAVDGPFPIVVRSGVRTTAMQQVLYALGRDAAGIIVDPSKVVTYAKNATETAHGKRRAGGTALDLDPVPATLSNYRIMGEWFEARGFEWGGRWTKQFPPYGDLGHVNIMGWRKLPV